MSTQPQTLMEKLVTEIDTKNSWGKNQLVETTIKIYRGINVSDNELIVSIPSFYFNNRSYMDGEKEGDSHNIDEGGAAYAEGT